MQQTRRDEKPENERFCNLSALANATPGEVRCPVCFSVVPPEHIGYKLHCRKCGYLESCCNPVG